jgi:hypothetical protein
VSISYGVVPAVDRDSQLSPRPTAKTISLGVALAIVASLALVAIAYFGSNADPNTQGSGQATSLTDKEPPPPGTSGR